MRLKSSLVVLALLALCAARPAPARAGWAGTKEGKAWIAKTSESKAGWRDEWTLWLADGIGGFAGKDGTAWDRIPMSADFSARYCPAYNSMSSDAKREFIIEVFKSVAKAESDWNPSSVNPTNTAAQGLFQMSGPVDMVSCRASNHLAPKPLNPKANILCAVQKLMPIFYWEHTFSTDTYGPQKLNNFFETLQVRKSAATLQRLKERIPKTVPDCRL